MPDSVSIVTTVKNSVNTIKRTLDSIVETKKIGFEYIIVDSNSKDGTLDIIREYSYYIDVLVSEEDNGIYQGMNKGWRLAKNKFIGILNAGDKLHAEGISFLINKIRVDLRHKKQIDIYYGNQIRIDDNRNMQRLQKPGKLSRIVKEPVLFHQATYIKKSIYMELNGYDEDFKIVGDYELLVRLYKMKKIWSYIDIPFVIFYSDGVSSSNALYNESCLLYKKLHRYDYHYLIYKLLKFKISQSKLFINKK